MRRIVRGLVALAVLAALSVEVPSSALGAPGSRAAGDEQLWVDRYDGPGHGGDFAYDVKASPDGSMVFVFGDSYGGASTHQDFLTIAYDPHTGQRLWQARYDGPKHDSDFGAAMAVSPDGSKVFVTGQSPGHLDSADILTVAYQASTGRRLWVERYGGPEDSFDGVSAIGVSPDSSTVFLTGTSESLDYNENYATWAYDASTGARRWMRVYDGARHAEDSPTALEPSPDGSMVFVAGTSRARHDDYLTIAYQAATGAPVWVARSGINHIENQAQSIAVSSDGSKVFVTGTTRSRATAKDIGTVAYDAVTGAQLWLTRVAGPGRTFDTAYQVAVSPDGSRVFVAGETDRDYATVAMDATTGSIHWESRFDDPPGSDAADPIRLAVAPNGSMVFVTGSTGPFGASWEYGTVAYDASNGTQLWDAFYEDPGISNSPSAIAVSPDGSEVFVTGSSYPWDYATIAYSTSG